MTDVTPHTPSTTPKAPAKPAKAPKKQGPIRFEAVIPAAIVIALVIVYFKLFFDTHLKMGIEIGGYHANGAEVNVADVDTSFWKLSFNLQGLEIADPENPMQNRLSISEIRSRLVWDALLRFKFVIDDAGIEGIQIRSPRKSKAKVKPPEPESSEPSAVAAAGQRGLEAAKEQYKGSALGDIAGAAGGGDVGATLGNLEGQLKSKAYIEQLSNELKGKEQEWKAKVDALPKGPELDALKAKIKNVKINTSDFNQLQASLKEIDAIAKEAGAKIGNVNQITNDLKNDLDKYSKAFEKLDALIKEDQQMLQSKLKIPSLDAKNLAGALFGPSFTEKLGLVEKYMRMGRKYMPPKKTKEELAAEEAERIKPPPRGKGIDYQFGRPNSYPLFWLQKATISSKATDAGGNGNLAGTLTDLTSDPPTIGRPTILDVKGDFPEQQMKGVELKIVVDHTTGIPKENVNFKVNAFPVQGQMLSQSDDARLGFNKADGGSKLEIVLEGENVKVELLNALQNIDYIAESKNEHISGILKGAVADIPRITLDASAVGTWDNLQMDIRSNLGTELAAAFQRQLQAKLDEAKKKVDEYMEKEIGPKKRELTEKYDEFRKKYLGQAEAKKAEVTQIQDQAVGKGKDAQNSGKKQAEDKAKKEVQKGLDDLKKKIGF